MDRSQRFALFLAELKTAPPAQDRAAARALVAETMNRIEDAHSGVPFDPAQWMNDGRLYPPHDDYEQASPVVDAALFHSLGHRIWFGDNGAIRIEVRKGAHTGRVELDKPGVDGEPCPRE